MKLIKTSALNSMTDSRLSDLSLLGVERDFVVDYDKVIDAFAIQHKNSRILLKELIYFLTFFCCSTIVLNKSVDMWSCLFFK